MRSWILLLAVVCISTVFLPAARAQCARETIGACCRTNGTCAASCPANCVGTFLGAGTTCSPTGCQPGACCDISGGCTVVLSANSGGCVSFQAQAVCGSVQCVVFGTCCTLANACAVTSRADCSGFWNGLVTTCQGNGGTPACVLSGACCNTARGECVVLTVQDCLRMDQIFRGGGTLCEPAQCVALPGACCTGTACAAVTRAQCAGEWRGAGTSCSPANPCCRADLDGSGTVDVPDIFVFLGAFFAGCN